MEIIWDEQKNERLAAERGLNLESIADIIYRKEYQDILKNSARQNQFIFVLQYNGYTRVVLFVIDDKERIVLKTVYPSRKFHKIYGKNEPEKCQ